MGDISKYFYFDHIFVKPMRYSNGDVREHEDIFLWREGKKV